MSRCATIYAALSILLLTWGISLAESQPQIQQPPQETAHSEVGRVAGQTLYVPIYSHIYYFNRQRRYNLATTLSIRNTDLQHSMVVGSVRYYDSDGNLLRNYLEQPMPLGPLASVDYVVDERDTKGGSGANFVVEWAAGQPMTAPVVEAVMISSGTQGVSFLSSGRVIDQRSR